MRVQVAYPASSDVELIGWPVVISVEEGLFHYLQECGWLHPYEAIWQARRPANFVAPVTGN